MKLNIWNLELMTIGDLELKRRKIKGLIAELDTIVIPIIALNLTFLFSVDSWQLFIPIIALKRAIFFGVKSWLLIPIFTLNWTIFLDVDSKALYPSLWFKLDNFPPCQKVDSLAFFIKIRKLGEWKASFLTAATSYLDMTLRDLGSKDVILSLFDFRLDLPRNENSGSAAAKKQTCGKNRVQTQTAQKRGEKITSTVLQKVPTHSMSVTISCRMNSSTM